MTKKFFIEREDGKWLGDWDKCNDTWTSDPCMAMSWDPFMDEEGSQWFNHDHEVNIFVELVQSEGIAVMVSVHEFIIDKSSWTDTYKKLDFRNGRAPGFRTLKTPLMNIIYIPLPKWDGEIPKSRRADSINLPGISVEVFELIMPDFDRVKYTVGIDPYES